MRAWLWNTAGAISMRLGLALCSLAGYLDAQADAAGYWTPARRARLARKAESARRADRRGSS